MQGCQALWLRLTMPFGFSSLLCLSQPTQPMNFKLASGKVCQHICGFFTSGFCDIRRPYAQKFQSNQACRRADEKWGRICFGGFVLVQISVFAIWKSDWTTLQLMNCSALKYPTSDFVRTFEAASFCQTNTLCVASPKWKPCQTLISAPTSRLKSFCSDTFRF